MATSRTDIRGWLEKAQQDGAEYMLVVCDTFDWADYPVQCSAETFWVRHDSYNRNMQKVMEVYDLSIDLEKQLNEFRAIHPPARA